MPPRFVQLDWNSATQFPVADPDWRRKIIRGGWILLIPLIGWPIILGYRSDAVFRLLKDGKPLLPNWDRGLGHYLYRGLQAMMIINIYYLPAWIYLIVKFRTHPGGAEIPWLWLSAFFAVLPIFSTLIIPCLTFWGLFLIDHPVFSLPESFALGVLFGGLTFLIPAGFLSVSRTRRMRSAFDFASGLRLVRDTFPRYVEAWAGSCAVSLIGHLCIPFSPWGVVWCYLAIIYSFNEVPIFCRNADDRAYLHRSAFPRFRDRFWAGYECVERGRFTERRHRKPIALDNTGVDAFSVVTLGPFRIPI
jgi:Protein of unknown function (DUF4013)